ncbi:hypothetical protein [Nostoc sp. NOS(2021)]|nr:hypothetical protein [Nostoc sp. NOS(2021)]
MAKNHQCPMPEVGGRLSLSTHSWDGVSRRLSMKEGLGTSIFYSARSLRVSFRPRRLPENLLQASEL